MDDALAVIVAKLEAAEGNDSRASHAQFLGEAEIVGNAGRPSNHGARRSGASPSDMGLRMRCCTARSTASALAT